MPWYIVKRAIQVIPVLLGITLISFLLGILCRGDPAEIALNAGGSYSPSPEEILMVRKQMGLDRPYHEQYLRWLGGVFRGDLGISFRTRVPVAEEIALRLPVTLKLSLSSLLLTVTVGIWWGVSMANRQDSFWDRIGQWVSILFLSVPGFWFAIMLISFFSEILRLLPSGGQGELKHLIMPTLVLSLGTIGTTMRLTRACMIRELSLQYVLTAQSKGLRDRIVLIRHALRNSLIPLVTLLGNYFGSILGGAVIVESIFAINGIGKFALDSIAVRDYPALQGYVLLTGTTFVAVSLGIDMIYYCLNPKIRFKGRGE
jgi:peptide/nickel transport system permease protein